jgi:hypothetical protein
MDPNSPNSSLMVIGWDSRQFSRDTMIINPEQGIPRRDSTNSDAPYPIALDPTNVSILHIARPIRLAQQARARGRVAQVHG